MECDYDLISKYQMLLQNERKRLDIADINLPEVFDEKQMADFIDRSSVESSNGSSNSMLQKKSPVKHTTFGNTQEISKAKILNNNSRSRTKNMDQCVSDSFYTSFPSFRKQHHSNINMLINERRQDYQKYLAEVSNKKLLDVEKSVRQTEEVKSADEILTKLSEKQEFSTRNKLLNDLKHSDLAFNFHNPDAIEERNRKMAIENTLKKIDYQKELIRQIEEKKLKIETLRAKEKAEDELLQRRLESQMKALQLADELNKNAYQIQKVLLADPIKASNDTVHFIPQLKEEDQSVNATQKSSSDNNAENSKGNSDRQIYKFFSNSAPHHDLNYHAQPVSLNSMCTCSTCTRNNEPLVHHSNQHCSRCRRVMPILCSSCSGDSYNRTCYCCNRCSQNMDMCNNCHRNWVQSWDYYGGVHTNRDSRNNCQRVINQPQILEITYQEDLTSDTNTPRKGDVVRLTHHDNRSPQGDDMGQLNNTGQNSSNSSTGNINENGYVSPDSSDAPAKSATKDEEIMELKRKNDILIAKYAKHYGSLRKREPKLNVFETNPQYMDDSFPLPLMNENVYTTKSKEVNVEKKRQNSQAVRKLEYKWEIPVVQKQLIKNKPMPVLTQIGAIAKQLQIEKLSFGDD